MPITPFVRAQWQHEHLANRSVLQASLTETNRFELEGPSWGRDSLRVETGVSAQVTRRARVFVSYATEAGRNYSAHSVTGGVQISF